MESYSVVWLIMALAIAGIGVLGWYLRQLWLRVNAMQLSLQTLSESLEGVSYGGVAQSERMNRAESALRKLESDSKRLQERADQMSLTEGENRAFTQAIRLASKGADVRELMETCDLSRSEAELVILLHSKQGAAGASVE